MNIIEAVKSGKRFKRKNGTAWLLNAEVYSYSRDCILADDWEIESQPVTITRADFDSAWESVTKYIQDTQPFFRADLARAMLCDKLGL